MSFRFQENVVVGVLLGIFAVYLVLASSLGPNARLVPLPTAGLGLIFLLVQLVRQNLRGGKEFHVDVLASLTGRTAADAPPRRDPEPAAAQARFRRELEAGAFLALFIGLIVLLGPIPAVFLFSTAFFVMTRHFAPWKAVAAGGALTLVLYVLFVIGLQLQLYHGVLRPLLDP